MSENETHRAGLASPTRLPAPGLLRPWAIIARRRSLLDRTPRMRLRRRSRLARMRPRRRSRLARTRRGRRRRSVVMTQRNNTRALTIRAPFALPAEEPTRHTTMTIATRTNGRAGREHDTWRRWRRRGRKGTRGAQQQRTGNQTGTKYFIDLNLHHRTSYL